MAETPTSGVVQGRDLARAWRAGNIGRSPMCERSLEAYEIASGARAGIVFYAPCERLWRRSRSEASFAKTGKIKHRTGALIFLDTNVISETLRQTPKPRCDRLARAQRCRTGIADGDNCRRSPSVSGNSPDQRAARLEQGLASWRHVLIPDLPLRTARHWPYGDLMLGAALRQAEPIRARRK